jgi:hypothetical protein
MLKATLAAVLAAIAVSGAGALGGCNDVGSCPAPAAITPGGSCSGDSLECAYDLPSPSPACDGTNTTIPTSCVCTKGSWVCPSPVSCEGGSGDDGGGDGATGDALGDGTGGDDGSTNDGAGGDASGG